MNILMTVILTFALSGSLAAQAFAEQNKPKTGEELFKEHCAVCHPDGGNIINPTKTLRKAHLEANNILTKEDVVNQMRHPGKGMTSWSSATLPDDVAEQIAEYILRTFK